MASYVCYNSNGKISTAYENKLTSLFQWDTNRTIVIRDVPRNVIQNVKFHFCNSKCNTAYVVDPEDVTNEYISAVIPNELMIQPDDIVIYLVEYADDDEVRTLVKIIIPLTPRPMPSNFIYQADHGDEMIANGLATTELGIQLTQDGVPFGAAAEV